MFFKIDSIRSFVVEVERRCPGNGMGCEEFEMGKYKRSEIGAGIVGLHLAHHANPPARVFRIADFLMTQEWSPSRHCGCTLPPEAAGPGRLDLSSCGMPRGAYKESSGTSIWAVRRVTGRLGAPATRPRDRNEQRGKSKPCRQCLVTARSHSPGLVISRRAASTRVPRGSRSPGWSK